MSRNGAVQLGYKLSSEEFPAPELVRLARRAEESGFNFALISDHYHPWTDREGHSPFVCSVIGGIANTTSKLIVGTGVTCPTTRIHPAIVAQAAATAASLMPGHFFLGVGTGENRTSTSSAKAGLRSNGAGATHGSTPHSSKI